jgi:hypothetical protein
MPGSDRHFDPAREAPLPQQPVGLLGMALLLWAGAAAAGVADWPGAAGAQLDALLAGIPPWGFVLAFVLLPALGFPISLFYVATGAVFAPSALALAVAWGCMALNMALSYGIAHWLARPVQALIRRRGLPLPQLGGATEWRVIVLLRASPLPYLMQSWLLAIGGARFGPYMIYGLPVQALIGAGLVLLGDSLMQGNLGWLLVAVAVLLLGQGALALLRHRLRRRSDPY